MLPIGFSGAHSKPLSPNVLLCVQNRTKCFLLISVVHTAGRYHQENNVNQRNMRALLCCFAQIHQQPMKHAHLPLLLCSINCLYMFTIKKTKSLILHVHCLFVHCGQVTTPVCLLQLHGGMLWMAVRAVYPSGHQTMGRESTQ
jgi:hypothetical protein